MSGQRGKDDNTLAAVLFDRPFRFAQEFVAAIGLRCGQGVDVVVLLRERGEIAIDHLHGGKLLRRVLVSQFVRGIADDCLVDSTGLGRFEYILNGQRTFAAPQRSGSHLGRHDMRMEIDDHSFKPYPWIHALYGMTA